MSPSSKDRVLALALGGCAIVAGLIVILILGFLAHESGPALRDVGAVRFFRDPSWHPSRDVSQGTYNLIPMIAGTALVTLGAMGLAGPLGLLSALFLNGLAPRAVAIPYRRLLELLVAIPSVVYGFWGLLVLAPAIGRIHPPGQSLLAGILILGLMILPTVALMADAAIGAIPPAALRQAAALGLSRWATLRAAILPSARSGLFAALVIGTARALGETMAVLMVTGNVVQTPRSPFDPVRTLTSNVALEMAYALGDHRSALFVSGLLLMGIVLLLVGCAGALRGRLQRV